MSERCGEDKGHFDGGSFMLGLTVAFLGTTVLWAALSEESQLKESAIAHCGAYYHPQTAKLTWKDCPAPASPPTARDEQK